MAVSVTTNLDLNKNQALNFVAQLIAGAHGAPTNGIIWYDSTAHVYKGWANGALFTFGTAGAGVPASTWNANTLVKADTDDTPVALAVAVDTLVGRATGVDSGAITDLTVTEARTLLGLTDENLQDIIGAMVSGGTETGIAVTYDDTNARFDFVVATLSSLPAPTGSLSLNSQKIISLADPTGAQDAATKAYVDGVIQGLSAKTSVRAATTVTGTLATAYENADVVDGVTLATGDRILLKNQSAGAENGIYTVNASGAPTRAVDMDVNAEVAAGLYVFVEEGTTNADSGWVLTTDGAITLGTTALAFVQFSGAGQITAGQGLTKTGNTIDLATTGVGLTLAADSLALDFTVLPKKFSANVGNASLTTIDVTHSLGTRDIVVDVYTNASPWDSVLCDVERLDTNTVRLKFAVAPASNAYRVVVVG